MTAETPRDPFRIRPATGTDIDHVVAIERVVYSVPWSRSSFAQMLSSPLAVLLVAADTEGTVAGYVVVLVTAPASELANIAVAREIQGTGLGRRLLEAAHAAARERGCREMFLEVRASNIKARSLYVSSGYGAVGLRATYYSHPPEDAIVMRVDLAVAGVPPDRHPGGRIRDGSLQ